MTNEEVISQIDSLIDNSRSFQEEKGDIWDKDIEALNLAKRAIQKQIPKKPINPCGRYYGKAKGGNCPCCGAQTNSLTNNYCRKCGQKLLWE